MNVMLSHPQGSQFVRATISAFNKAGQLSQFNTTLAFEEDAVWLRLLPAALRKELLRRSYPVSGDKIVTYPLKETVRMLSSKFGVKSLIEHEKGWASVDSVYQDLDSRVAARLPLLKSRMSLDAVYSYEDGALSTFQVAKKLGLKCIYDLPIAYWETGRKLMKEEAERLPAWAITLGGGIKNSDRKQERKVQELELADFVVVPGSFVADSLPAWARTKQIIVSPFGTPLIQNRFERPEFSSKRPLRILFVGSLGQRKGLGDLFEAMKIVNRKDVELVVLGSLLAPLEFYRNQYPDFIYEPGRPHEDVLKLMSTCDVFCLPSIVEGRAQVMQEAMSQQLPLIITPNTGGADLVIEGENGFLVPIRSPEAIAVKITWFLNNRELIPNMGKKAHNRASEYTWESYGNKIVNSVNGKI